MSRFDDEVGPGDGLYTCLSCRCPLDEGQEGAVSLTVEAAADGERHVCEACWELLSIKDRIDLTHKAESNRIFTRLTEEIIARLEGTNPYFTDRGEN